MGGWGWDWETLPTGAAARLSPCGCESTEAHSSLSVTMGWGVRQGLGGKGGGEVLGDLGWSSSWAAPCESEPTQAYSLLSIERDWGVR